LTGAVLAAALLSWTGQLAAAQTDDAGWVLARDDGDIKAYVRQSDDSRLLAFKVVAPIDAPIELVLSVVLDAEHAEDWLPRLRVSEILRWIDEPLSFVQYTEFNAPWPVGDRVFVSRVELRVDPETFAADIRYYDSEDAALNEAAIKGSAHGSYYLLRPIDGGRRTHFTAVSMADPKGRIPTWMINWIGRSWAPGAMSNLRDRVASPKAERLRNLAPLFVGFDDAMIQQTTIQAPPGD
jgi:hypothetical protein